MILLRVTHILLGVFWAGALFFIAAFLLPSLRDAGPEGGKVMLALQRRRFLDIMPVVAALTILSGLDLYRRVSNGFQAAWIRSPMGLSLTAGAILAIVAFAIGVGVMRPASLRAGRLAQALPQTPEGPARDAQAAEIQRSRLRAAASARWVAGLLALSVLGMAAARYL